MPKDYKQIARVIKEARKERDISTYELADRVDKSQSYISNVENGKFPISFKQANEILKALDKELVISTRYKPD